MADSPTSRGDAPDIPPTLHTAGVAGYTGSLPGSATGSPTAPPPLPGSGPVPASPAPGGVRFQILRPYDSGGMGDLFVARDLELGREVIVKKIQGDTARNADAVARFVAEAQITGLLEHPGIVPVYGFGRHDDGHVYYAMRLIHGVNLLQAVNRFHDPKEPRDRTQRDLGLRGLLRRFVDICNAVGYAHNRGVIHRDIKPANVMLGPFGETLVIDWGLAKIVGRPESQAAATLQTVAPAAPRSSSTHVGQTVGTPMYMSPEQAAGLHDQLTAASDVYSLGVTLYQLLTGKVPFVGTRNYLELLDRVKRGEIVRPRKANGDVPAALEAVCLKAMAREPTDRYATAPALAADLERWLADEPVSVRRESWYARLGRYARKRQRATGAAAAVLLTAALALCVGFLVVRYQKQETERQRADAEAARARAVAAEETARRSAESEKDARLQTEQTAAAEKKAREKADRRSQLTLDTLTSLFDLQRQLEQTPGSLRVREQLLTAAIEGLQDVGRDADTDAGSADLIRAVLHHERAQILRTVGQTAAAVKDWRAGHDVFLRLSGEKPEDALLKHSLAVSWSRGGQLAQDEGDFATAHEGFEKSLRLHEELVKGPRPAKGRHDLAVALGQFGFVLLLEKKTGEARDHLRRCLDLTDQMAADDPKGPTLRHEQVVNRERLVTAYLHDDLAAARVHAEKGLALAEQAARDDPKYLPDLAILLERTADVRTRLGDGPGALAAADRQVKITGAVARADTDNVRAQFNLVIALRRRGELSRRFGDLASARKDYQAEKGIAEQLAQLVAVSLRAQVELALSCRDLAHVERLDGQFALAETLFGQAAREFGRAQRDPRRKGDRDMEGQTQRAELWRAVCRLAPDAIKDEATVLKQENGFVVFHLFDLRVRWFAKQRQHAEAAAGAGKMRDRFKNGPDELVDVAACYALCAGSAAEKADGDHYAEQALALLRQALDAGYKDLGVLGLNAEFAALRERDDFKKLFAELEKKARP